MRKTMDPAMRAAWLARVTGPEPLAAPSVEGIATGAYRFTLRHDGQDHYAVCSAVDGAGERERLFRECREDLASYVGGFVSFGCGWPGHEFDGDITDLAIRLECVKCGASKLINQRLEAPAVA